MLQFEGSRSLELDRVHEPIGDQAFSYQFRIVSNFSHQFRIVVSKSLSAILSSGQDEDKLGMKSWVTTTIALVGLSCH
jgi:hypothetical protein